MLTKEKLKSLCATLAVNVLLITIAVYVLFQYAKTGVNAIETEQADMEIRQDIVEADGYIFRNEEVIYSNGGKSVNYLIENGGKVGKNQAVAQSLPSSADFSAKDRISVLNKKLDILNKSNINLDFVATNIEKIDRDSYAMYLNMMQGVERGKFKEAGKNRDELLILLNKKQLIIGEMSGSRFGDIIAAAESQKKQLEAQASAFGAEEVYSNRSGIFYSAIDGYENYFTAEAAQNINFEKFGELLKKTRDYNVLNNALGKVAYDFNWYIVCNMPKSKNAHFADGDKYAITYPSSNKTINSVLCKRIEDVESGDAILVFETSDIPFDFDFYRKQTIQIVFSEVSGIKVPEEAIRIVEMEDGTLAEGVYVQKGSSVVFRELPKSECLAKFDGYYIYLAPSKRPETGGGKLQLYEDIIVAGKNLYDGQAIK